MQKRKLGNSGIETGPLALGGNIFGWTIDEAQSHNILDGFVNAGLNLIDTADVYSRWKPGNHGGESETIIGNWMKKRGNRDKVIISTKVGSDMGDGKKGLSKAYILQAVDASLKRLQTDHMDIYFSHFDDNETPVDETMEAYYQLIKAGKIKVAGASNLTPDRLKESLEASREMNIPTYQALQPLYNLYDRDNYERDYEPICQQYGLGVICYYSLASGFLTGKYRTEKDFTKSPRGGGMRKFMNERGMAILSALDSVSLRYNVKPATIALAWLMARPTVTAPIASATTAEQLNDLVKATEIQLDDAAIKELAWL